MPDTIDLYHVKEQASRDAIDAWKKYENLVQNGGSSEDRLSALRAAIQADQELAYANQEWRSANNLGW